MGWPRTFAHRVWAGLTLQREAYAEMAGSDRPASSGLVFVVTIGLIVGIASAVGTGLEIWTSPNPGDLKSAIWEGVQGMPWLEQIPAEDREAALDSMRNGFDTVWRVVEAFWPSAGQAALGLIATPLSLLAQWLVFGVLAFSAARLLGGGGTLAATLGATALAASPQALGIFSAVPGVGTAGLGLWSLICGYVAIKHVHGLSAGRAFWAALGPLLIGAFVLVGGVAVAIGVLIASLAATGVGQ